jgi:hypothetical protein
MLAIREKRLRSAPELNGGLMPLVADVESIAKTLGSIPAGKPRTTAS